MDDRVAYAKYELLEDLSYNIITYLLHSEDAEILWKLLYYTDADAYEKPNLTLEQKRSLIYAGQEDATKYRIFMDKSMADGIWTEDTYLRIFPFALTPENRTVGICTVGFQIFSHFKVNTLSNCRTRIDTIVSTLLKALNGVDINGVGVLYFDERRSSTCGMLDIGDAPYRGKILKMCVNIG